MCFIFIFLVCIILKVVFLLKMNSSNRILWFCPGLFSGVNWEIGIDIYTLLYIKLFTEKDLLYSTENYTQYSVMAYMGKESMMKNPR